MSSKYVVFAVALLLALPSAPIAFAFTNPVLPAGRVQTNGPRLEQVNFVTVGSEATASSNVKLGSPIMSWDLSWSTSVWNSFCQYSKTNLGCPTSTGKTSSYGFDGIYFNDLRAPASTVAFHRAIAYLWNQSQFQNVVLGPSGTASGGAFWPCTTFPSACDKNPPNWGTAAQYAKASAQLCLAGLVPTGYPGPGTACDGIHFSSSTVWHNASATGPVYNPNWYWRQSLSRHYFSDWIVPNGAKIGLHFNLLGDGSIIPAIYNVFNYAASQVLSDGVFVPGTPTLGCTTYGCPGYNSAPSYDYSKSGNASAWDMYSYGYSAGANYVALDWEVNTAYGAANINAANLHNATIDMLSNLVIYATSPGKAASANRPVAHAQMQDLTYFNIYYQNALWAVFSQGWLGYAAIFNYGPITGGGLDYNLLNVYRGCYDLKHPGSNTCPNGGTFKAGLANHYTVNGGMNPYKHSTTVYDNDIWSNIYDSPLNVPTTGFSAPLKFMNWMTKSYSIHKLASFTTGSGTGWFATQPGICTPTCTLTNGAAITFNFQPNIFWSDHVAFTAYDYNFSLYLSDAYAPPSLPDAYSAYTGTLAGPAGLMATYINPATPLSITLYLNTQSAWNLPNTQVPAVPLHVFGGVNTAQAAAMGVTAHPGYFNLDRFTSVTGQLDTALNAVAATTCGGCGVFASGVPMPEWLKRLPNLEIGTGPFLLNYPRTSAEETTYQATLLRNPTFYRPFYNLYAYNSTDSFSAAGGSGIAHVVIPLYEWSYDPTACAAAVDKVCKVPIGNATTATWAAVKGKLNTPIPGHTGTMTFIGPNNKYQADIPLTFGTGLKHIVFTFTYTFHGLPRTYYLSYSIFVTP